MSTITPKRLVTPAELETMPDQARFELVDGELVERKVSALSSLVELKILVILAVYCQKTNLGELWPSSLGCRCFPGRPDKIRRPDGTFVRRERLAPGYLRQGFLTIVPDLVVEVLSPNDTAYEVREKTEDYLGAGVLLVWNVDPEARIVEIHRRDGTVTKLHASDEITGEDVLPGFSCRVEAFFPAPDELAATR
jgi:Uma2 family endonuclease